MSVVWTILIGFAAGFIAKFIMPGKDPSGIIITILLGIAGSFIFTYLGQFLGLYQEGETAGFIGAVIGAVILLAIYTMFKKKSG